MANRPDELSQAALDVLAERQRQIAKGWTEKHDDDHDFGEIINSSWGAIERLKQADSLIGFSGPKRQKARERLVEAGALILAEIEHMDRATYACSLPSPLAGEGGARSATDEGTNP